MLKKKLSNEHGTPVNNFILSSTPHKVITRAKQKLQDHQTKYLNNWLIAQNNV